MQLRTDEQGTATGEFVLIALPLFLPALFFFLAMSHIARSEMETSFIAREAVRAFTTGSDDEEAHLRVQSLLAAYQSPELSYSISCSSHPCITPGARVELTLFTGSSLTAKSGNSLLPRSNFWGNDFKPAVKERLSIAKATAYVDTWQ